ncbi:serine/threonine-protein phosphatase 6 regulatory ankyrin repeat subunit A isoform X1 [Arachis ipaensis]|uniref:protein VAPYRIN-LIKE n=2 Tax=Arachis TaxID=3817 RepID=UPI0007AF2495|nr:serine/threonine-protein phosphatase 6 regulatory ankyrin repeat subunit A isoform X1 [Arachis ipaensis]XP_025662854.1 serine/threonine-protein phosphatase 6 regulatory ankyrin repeat subunit A [Arachis hypogaea]QHN84334.1 Ankyrin [Arachis hypogaea]
MDRLVKPDVKEVEMIFEKTDEKCSATFRLTNLMHAMAVAVSLTTTNPSSPFSIDIPLSTIPPLSSSTYTISLSHLSDNGRLFSTAPESVAVVTSMLLAGKSHNCDDLRRLFLKPGPHVFNDAVIPVSIVGPHFAEFLISNHIPRSRSLLHKAISRCPPSQLTDLLTYAVECGNAESVAVLIDAGADSNSKDSNGKSLVPLAIRAGNEINVVKVLLASGCVIENKVDLVLHEAAAANRVDLMRLLFEFIGEDDADVDSVNHEGRTPIHVAALHGHVDVIRYCVSMRGNPNVVDRKGWTPLHCAASEGQLGAVESLLAECGCDAKRAVDREGKTAFAIAMENGHVELGDLLHWGDVLFRAARVGDVHGMASCLTVGGADVNGRDQNGWTALHWAALKGKVKSVEVLIDNGAEVDPVDEVGYTPLRCAVESGHLQVALFLVARGSCATLDTIKASKGLFAPPRLLDSFGKLTKHVL